MTAVRVLYQAVDRAAVCPPMAFQARCVYKAIASAKMPLSVKDIAQLAIDNHAMGTIQDPERIVRYYLPLLLSHKLIKKEKA